MQYDTHQVVLINRWITIRAKVPIVEYTTKVAIDVDTVRCKIRSRDSVSQSDGIPCVGQRGTGEVAAIGRGSG